LIFKKNREMILNLNFKNSVNISGLIVSVILIREVAINRPIMIIVKQNYK
jgi:hypothetical protein